MQKYYYKAKNAEGKIYEGAVAASSKAQVYEHIKKEGGVPIKVSKEKDKIFSLEYWNQRLSTVSQKDKIIFATNLAAMLAAGISSTHALSILEKQAKNPRLKYAIGKIKSLIESGFSMHAAFSKFPDIFPPIFIAMVRAGEKSGELPKALQIVAKQIKNSYEIKKRIQGAMTYPAIIVLAIVAIGAFMMVKVVPTLANTFKTMKIELPKSTKFVLAMAEFIQDYYLLLILALLSLPVLTIYLSKKHRYIIDKILLSIPLISTLYNEINSAYFARTMASLLGAGVHLLEALDITKDVLPSCYHKKVLQEAQEVVKHGGLVSSVLSKHEKLFPIMLTEMLAVGEQTGKSTDMLEQIAQFYEKEVEQKTKTFSTIIEPALMLLVGLAVGFFAIAMISPIYSITQGFGG